MTKDRCPVKPGMTLMNEAFFFVMAGCDRPSSVHIDPLKIHF